MAALLLAGAGWLLALWAPTVARRRSGAVLLAGGLVATVVDHGNYVVWVGIAVAGYLLAFVVARAWPAVAWRRHAAASVGLLAATLVLLVAMLGAWGANPQLGRGSESAAAVESQAETFEGAFVGEGTSLRLAPAQLVPTGGIALLALVALPLVTWRLRRLAGTLAVAGTFLLTIA